MKEWQFNVLFFVAVGGALFLLIAPVFHLDTGSPAAAAGIGVILTFVLQQKYDKEKKDEKDDR
jgi:hypothetical protein